jgi:hypothetical protein
MSRLVTSFRKGAGLASPALIVVWLALGAGLLWLQWAMSSSEIVLYSGNVKAVSTDPQYGTHVAIDSSSLDFFFDANEFPQLPDIEVGDHVDILTQPQSKGSAVAVQSQRGTWIQSYSQEVAPFTPQTWGVHEVLRWSALALGILAAVFGGASLVRWIPSAQIQAASSFQAPAPDPDAIEEPTDAAAKVEADPDANVSGESVEQASSSETASFSDRAATAVWIGGITVTALPILELIGVISGLGSCTGAGSADALLIAITIALTAGGVGTLILASTSQAGSPRRALARRLGIVAVVMAAVSVPVNVFVVGLTGFCAVG